MRRSGMPRPHDDVTRATHGPLLSTRDRRALAVCVVLGLLGWIGIFRQVDISLLPPVERPADNPAPQGVPKSIATAAMKDSNYPCGAVLDATRLSDGSIRAVCSNGEAYLVFSLSQASAPR